MGGDALSPTNVHDLIASALRAVAAPKAAAGLVSPGADVLRSRVANMADPGAVVNPVMRTSTDPFDLAPAADARSRTTGAQPAAAPDTTSSFAPSSVSDTVRGGVSTPFNAANMADPASLASAPKDALAQLTAVFTPSNLRSAHETLRLAQDLENLFGGDQPPQLPPTSRPMKLPAGRGKLVPPPKAAPRIPPRRALALSGSRGRQQQQLQQLLLKLLGARTG